MGNNGLQQFNQRQTLNYNSGYNVGNLRQDGAYFNQNNANYKQNGNVYGNAMNNFQDMNHQQGGYINDEYSYNGYNQNGVYSDSLNDNYSYYGMVGYTEDMYNRAIYDYYNNPDNSQFILQNADIDDEPFITTKDLLSLGICLALAFMLAYLMITYVVQHTMVSGTSMSYNFANEDILIIDRATYYFREPERYDVIIFPTKDDTFYIKRIIGLPGETVKVDKETGLVYINDQVLDEDYGFEPIRIVGDNSETTLGEDEYYVMGDNRNDSQDSRFSVIGNIKREYITGRAIFRIWPLDSFGQIDNLVNAKIKDGQMEKPAKNSK